MNLPEYFENTKGTGVLATADGQGKVNAAVYATPHVMADGSLAFIMRDRLSHHNLQSNPHAAYLFHEAGGGFRGRRFHLSKIREERNSELAKTLCRRCRVEERPDADRYLVFFRVDKQLPLIGGGT